MNNKTMDQETIDNLLKIEGETRGVVFQTDGKYVLAKEGRKGFEKLKQKSRELGLDIDYEGAETMDWYPIGLRAISLLLIKETFDWSAQEIKEMGRQAPKTSFVAKLFFKLFLSVEKLIKEVPRFWQEHHTIGRLEVVEYDEARKIIILRLHDLNLHPIFCFYLEGYFETIMAFTREGTQVTAKEEKCSLKEIISYHQYRIIWR